MDSTLKKQDYLVRPDFSLFEVDIIDFRCSQTHHDIASYFMRFVLQINS